MEIEPYNPGCKKEWDQFVSASGNGVFLFYRDFMEYHADRYRDASLIIRDDEQIVGVLPAHWSGAHEIASYAGLTFGGLVQHPKLKSVGVLEVFQALTVYFKSQGVTRFIYKPVPGVFQRTVSCDDLYALFRCGYRLYRRDLSSVIDLRSDFTYATLRKRGMKKALKGGIGIQEQNDYEQFVEMLNARLEEKHNTHAVHTADELALLAGRFPERIKLYVAVDTSGVWLSGVLVFKYNDVFHTQYITSTEQGRTNGSLDLLMHTLIEAAVEEGSRYFSFGASTEDGGRVLNEGLVRQKEGFGARSVVHDFYELKL